MNDEIEEELPECDNCGRSVDESDLNEAGCDSCTTWCDYGEHYVDTDYWGRGHHDYCPECADAYDEDNYESEHSSGEYHVIRCEACNAHTTITHWHPITEVGVCLDCADGSAEYIPLPVLEAVAA